MPNLKMLNYLLVNKLTEELIKIWLASTLKSIIKYTVKSQSIKKEAVEFDQSLLECELTSTDTTSSSFSNSKRIY